MVPLNLFGSAQRQKLEQDAHAYVQTYVQLHLAAPIARTVLFDHPATRAAFPAAVSVATVGSLMLSKRHRGRPSNVIGAAVIGVAAGSLTYYWQQRSAHRALLLQLEKEVIPHMIDMHDQNKSLGVQSYGEFVKLMEEKAEAERKLLGLPKSASDQR